MIKTTEGTEKSCNSSLLNLGTNFTAIVEPTHGCNLECKYCYLNKNAESGRMDVKTLKNSIVGVSEFIGKCKTIDFLWHGGEPLLGGIDFFKKVIIIQKEMGEDYTFENTIQTNGTLITEEIADFFRDYKFNVGLSLDGPEEINNRTRSYSKGSHSKHNKGGSGGGCYLTTACTKAMNLPDDCYELNVLRSFRDNILMSQPTGKKAVREYYNMAPEIVQAVEEQEDAQVIWRSVYRDIGQAVSLVLSNDFEGALKHYKKLSLDLKQRYLD